MRKHQCDICGVNVDSEWKLDELLEEFQTCEVKDLCKSCSRDISKKLSQISEIITTVKSTFIRRYIKAMTGDYIAARMKELRGQPGGDALHVAAIKSIGW